MEGWEGQAGTPGGGGTSASGMDEEPPRIRSEGGQDR